MMLAAKIGTIACPEPALTPFKPPVRAIEIVRFHQTDRFDLNFDGFPCFDRFPLPANL